MRIATSMTVLGLVWLLTACATFESNAYKTLGTVAVTVDAAMNGWGDYVRLGKATRQQELVVRDAYEDYQLAMSLASAAVTAYRSSGNKPPLEAAMAGLDTAKNEIIDLILRLTK